MSEQKLTNHRNFYQHIGNFVVKLGLKFRLLSMKTTCFIRLFKNCKYLKFKISVFNSKIVEIV